MKYFKIASTVLCISASTNALALVQTEVSVGQRTQGFIYDTATEKDKIKTASGTELAASVLFDPMPVIPIAFGLTFQSASIDRSKVDEEILNDTASSVDSDSYSVTSKGTTSTVLYGPMIKVWAPTPFVKPYLKFAYLMGSGVNKLDMSLQSNDGVSPNFSSGFKGTQKFSHTGTDLDIGLAFSPTKLFSMFFEYAMHTGSSKVTDQSIESSSVVGSEVSSGTLTKDDLTDEDKKANKANAVAIRLGVSVGF